MLTITLTQTFARLAAAIYAAKTWNVGARGGSVARVVGNLETKICAVEITLPDGATSWDVQEAAMFLRDSAKVQSRVDAERVDRRRRR